VALLVEAAKVDHDPALRNCHPPTVSRSRATILHALCPYYGPATRYGVTGIAVQLMPWHGEHATLAPSIASIPGNPHLAARARVNGLAGQIAARDLFARRDGARNGKRSLSKIHGTWRQTLL